MIEGVRLLPWVAAQDRLNPSPDGAYDCTVCKRAYDESHRRHLRCGWMRGGVERDAPEGEQERVYGDWKRPLLWRGVNGRAIGGRLGPTVCPGYTIKLPQVQEVARWWGWEKRAVLDVQLEHRDVVVTEELLDLADVFAGEAGQAESWEMSERTKRARG